MDEPQQRVAGDAGDEREQRPRIVRASTATGHDQLEARAGDDLRSSFGDGGRRARVLVDPNKQRRNRYLGELILSEHVGAVLLAGHFGGHLAHRLATVGQVKIRKRVSTSSGGTRSGELRRHRCTQSGHQRGSGHRLTAPQHRLASRRGQT